MCWFGHVDQREKEEECNAKRRPDPSRPACKIELTKCASNNVTNNKNTFFQEKQERNLNMCYESF